MYWLIQLAGAAAIAVALAGVIAIAVFAGGKDDRQS